MYEERRKLLFLGAHNIQRAGVVTEVRQKAGTLLHTLSLSILHPPAHLARNRTPRYTLPRAARITRKTRGASDPISLGQYLGRHSN